VRIEVLKLTHETRSPFAEVVVPDGENTTNPPRFMCVCARASGDPPHPFGSNLIILQFDIMMLGIDALMRENNFQY
jgi:hypothetical protein